MEAAKVHRRACGSGAARARPLALALPEPDPSSLSALLLILVVSWARRGSWTGVARDSSFSVGSCAVAEFLAAASASSALLAKSCESGGSRRAGGGGRCRRVFADSWEGVEWGGSWSVVVDTAAPYGWSGEGERVRRERAPEGGEALGVGVANG